MDLDSILQGFIDLTTDAVLIGRRGSLHEPATVAYVNPAFLRSFGYTRSEVLGGPASISVAPEGKDALFGELKERMNAGQETFQIETECIRKDRSRFWATVSYRVFYNDDGSVLIVGTHRDITALHTRERRAEQALRDRDRSLASMQAAQDRLVAALESFPDPFVIYDKDMRLVQCNTAYRRATTKNPADLRIGKHVEDILRLSIRDGLLIAPDGNTEAHIRKLLDIVRRDEQGIGDLRLPDDRHQRVLRSRAANGDYVVIRMDTTELVHQRRAVEEYARMLEEANSAILHEAVHDQLTGLGNRRFLLDRFEELSRRRRAEGGDIAILHIDLDRFKQINDTIGHAAGDHVLIEVARRLLDTLGPRDVATRVGGDEFIVLIFVGPDKDRPEALAADLVQALARPTLFDGKECRFGASIGVATTMVADEGSLLAESDIALYKAKRAGRGQFAVFDQSDMDEMRRTKSLADDIMRGLEAGEFIPYFQPQVDAATGRIVGLEALARWAHPQHGIVAPDVFIPIADDLNVVADIDRMVFEKAIAEAAAAFAWHADPPGLSFNVSIRSVLSPDLERIGRLTAAYPGQVAFELLETIFLEEADVAFLMQLDRFRDMGLAIEVDDFGSGRASVVALQKIAPDRLKIDRRLIEPLAQTPGARQLVRSIIEIGHAMQIGVTAEGVETAEQARILHELGCDRLQGFHFSRPLPLDAVLPKIGLAVPNRPRRATRPRPAGKTGG